MGDPFIKGWEIIWVTAGSTLIQREFEQIIKKSIQVFLKVQKSGLSFSSFISTIWEPAVVTVTNYVRRWNYPKKFKTIFDTKECRLVSRLLAENKLTMNVEKWHVMFFWFWEHAKAENAKKKSGIQEILWIIVCTRRQIASAQPVYWLCREKRK